jgi:hypothetical protein
MKRFYFDMRDDDQFYPDDEGTELDGLVAARDEAFASLEDYVKGITPTGSRRCVSVEVSDGNHQPLIMAVLTLEVVPLDHSQRR